MTLERLHGGLSNVAFVADDARRALRRALRRRHSRPSRLSRSRTGGEHRRTRRGAVAGACPRRAGSHGRPPHRGQDARRGGPPENIARIVPLLAICHRDVARHLEGPASMFWVVPRDSRQRAHARDVRKSGGRRPARLRRARRCARGEAGAAAHRVRPSRSAARQFHRRRRADLAHRLGIRRVRHRDVRSRESLVQRQISRRPTTGNCSRPISSSRCAATCSARSTR